MEMIAHDDVAEELPVAADDRLLETVDQPTSVGIIADDLLPGVAPRHHVIDGTLKLDPKSPWRVQSSDPRQIDFLAENKKQPDTAKLSFLAVRLDVRKALMGFFETFSDFHLIKRI
jgi:hypothetical protein